MSCDPTATSSTRRRVILIAVDASEHASNAFHWYLNEIYRKDDYIILCHVPEHPDLPTFSFKRGLSPPIEEWQKAIEEQLESIRNLETKFNVDLLGKKIPHKFHVEQSKQAGPGIVSVAESERAALIVIGTRGLDLVRRTLLGSVSEYVVRHSKVPVLVCPNLIN